MTGVQTCALPISLNVWAKVCRNFQQWQNVPIATPKILNGMGHLAFLWFLANNNDWVFFFIKDLFPESAPKNPLPAFHKKDYWHKIRRWFKLCSYWLSHVVVMPCTPINFFFIQIYNHSQYHLIRRLTWGGFTLLQLQSETYSYKIRKGTQPVWLGQC